MVSIDGTADPMSDPCFPPLVGITCCLRPADHAFVHQVGDKYVDAVVDGAEAVPVLIPALGARLDVDALLGRLDGLLVTGSPSNVDPALYGGPPPRPGNLADPARDATTLPLIRRALALGVPLFAICRGLQELNVALGGTLHQHLHELPGRRDHRSNKDLTPAERYGPAHPVRLARGGFLQRLLGGAESIVVNSLHAQGIDRLAPGLVVEAVAEDGTVEAVTVAGASSFALAVQWHPEWRVRDNPDSLRLFRAFGAAARERAAHRMDHVTERDLSRVAQRA